MKDNFKIINNEYEIFKNENIYFNSGSYNVKEIDVKLKDVLKQYE